MKRSRCSLSARVGAHAVFSRPCASLWAVGEYLRQRHFFTTLDDNVQIAQKTPQQDPVDKLLEVLLSALRGAPPVYESNPLVRPYPDRWQAVG